jgi:tetratricopeptide (TPR) repeat protein
MVLASKGKVSEAITFFKQALEHNPHYAPAHYNLGLIFASQGLLDQAIEHYQKAIQIDPDDAEAHYQLAMTFGLHGQLTDAVEQFKKTIELKPDDADAHGNLAKLLATQGRLEEADKEYQQTLKLVPHSAQAHYRYGQALQVQHRFSSAKAELQQTLELNPHNAEVCLSLAWLLATCPEASVRDGNKAVALAEAARASGGDASPQMLDILAAAYAEAGRYGEAVETAKRALNLPASQNDKALADAIQSRLKLYEAHVPYHEKP